MTEDFELKGEIPPFQRVINDKMLKKTRKYISIVDKVSHHFGARTSKLLTESFQTLSIHPIFNPPPF